MINQSPLADGLATLGRIVGLFGVHGWIKVHSYARPREAILAYNPWLVRAPNGWREHTVVDGHLHGKGLVARLEGYADRDQAAALVGADIAVPMARLPALAEGEYYWAQLEGLRVINVDGRNLGLVSHLIETGANDVMVVVREKCGAGAAKEDRTQLIPYVREVVREVNLHSGVILVEWDPDF